MRNVPNINFLESRSKQIVEEIKNIPLEGDRLIALARNLTESTDLLRKQGVTESERAKQVQWLAVKTMLEGDLLNLDVKAAVEAGNIRKEFGQYAPMLDSLIRIIDTFSRAGARSR